MHMASLRERARSKYWSIDIRHHVRRRQLATPFVRGVHDRRANRLLLDVNDRLHDGTFNWAWIEMELRGQTSDVQLRVYLDTGCSIPRWCAACGEDKGGEMNEWIPVSERLPEVYTDVLVLFAGHTVYDISWRNGRGWHDGHTPDLWMPLPEPPSNEVLTAYGNPTKSNEIG